MFKYIVIVYNNETHNNNRCICVCPKVAGLEDVTEIRAAGRQDEAVGGHMSAAGRRQEHVGERLRLQQRRHRAVQVLTITVPLELIILRHGDGHR